MFPQAQATRRFSHIFVKNITKIQEDIKSGGARRYFIRDDRNIQISAKYIM